MIKLTFAVLALTLAVSTPASADELQPVERVDLARYAGAWYEIASKPTFFQKGCVCTRQVLTARADGQLDVYNSCNKKTPQGKLRDIRGTAENVDPSSNAKFKVDFGFPWKGDYWIIGLAEDYSWAVVSDPGNTTLYILSKTPTLSQAAYDQAVASAAKQKDTSVLAKTRQADCTYP